MKDGWVRQRGRADYPGWKLDIVGDKALMHVGHSLPKCLLFLVAFHLGWLKEAPMCGRIKSMRLLSPTNPPPC